MARLPAAAPLTAATAATAADSADDGAESAFADSAWQPPSGTTGRPTLWRRPRTRLLVLLALFGAALLVLWWLLLARAMTLDAQFRPGPQGRPVLQASQDPQLQPALGLALLAIVQPDGRVYPVRADWLARSPRWVVDDADRLRQQADQQQLAEALQQPQLTLQFDDGLQVTVRPQPRGLQGLGLACWLLGAMALALYAVAVVVVLDRPSSAAVLFALMLAAQALNLLLVGAEAMPGLGGQIDHDLALRLLADAVLGAALVQVVLHYPTPLARAALWATPVWLAALGLAALGTWQPTLPGLWWWAQALLLGCIATALVVMRLAQRQRANPLAAMLQRLILAGGSTLALLTLSVALADQAGLAQPLVARVGSAVWHVFAASLLMLAPFLSRSRRVAREFALLAGMCTVVCSLDLLFIAVLGIGQAAAITLALAVSLLLYAGARHWVLTQVAGSGTISAERMFESLYRAARELEQSPERAGEQLAGLLREVFDPLELARSGRPASRIRLAQDGSAMRVPVPQLNAGRGQAGAIVMRFAHRGRRLFNREDVQLTERIIEQLRRAAAYDHAVEHGRHEERTRIAQDLHDDIGARLLTLMYKAQNPEIEEYIRHTLQDLKTLTRGLAVGDHKLSHAAAEWKADLTQRLNAIGCDLNWSFSSDRDLTLSVVQWSGLTRILRELVNNIISHARATQVEIVLQVDRRRLLLTVSDDGVGRAPETWSHGLGLGGVRKRVKLLGGTVGWLERQPQGIRCEVQATLKPERG